MNAPLTRSGVIRMAVPMIFANATEPLAGVVDTVVIGMTADDLRLGGVALGVTLANVVIFNVYFLRMSTTGLVAQAVGAGDELEAGRTLQRSLALAIVLGLGVVIFRPLIAQFGLQLLAGEPQVEKLGNIYFQVRALGLPASFGLYALTGWLLAHGRSREVMVQQVAFSATNIGLDLLFVLGMGWGIWGVAAATAIARWVAIVIAALQVYSQIGPEVRASEIWPLRSWLSVPKLRALLIVNLDFMIRTWGLLIGFTWFTNSSASSGTVVLGANHVLLQTVTLWAFVLDAYAFVAETYVGRAIGAQAPSAFRRAVKVTLEFALLSGALFALLTLFVGPSVIRLVVLDPNVREVAIKYLPWCALVPFLGAGAWQLDGVFIGAMNARAMRNATIIATTSYIALDLILRSSFGPDGLWPALVCFYLARGLTLAAAYPALKRNSFPVVMDAAPSPLSGLFYSDQSRRR